MAPRSEAGTPAGMCDLPAFLGPALSRKRLGASEKIADSTLRCDAFPGQLERLEFLHIRQILRATAGAFIRDQVTDGNDRDVETVDVHCLPFCISSLEIDPADAS